MMGKLLNVGKRLLTGESIFMTHFTNLGALRSLRGKTMEILEGLYVSLSD
jgi:uncharacterized protein (AIM24 family)